MIMKVLSIIIVLGKIVQVVYGETRSAQTMLLGRNRTLNVEIVTVYFTGKTVWNNIRKINCVANTGDVWYVLKNIKWIKRNRTNAITVHVGIVNNLSISVNICATYSLR